MLSGACEAATASASERAILIALTFMVSYFGAQCCTYISESALCVSSLITSQTAMPLLLADILSYDSETGISWTSLAYGGACDYLIFEVTFMAAVSPHGLSYKDSQKPDHGDTFKPLL